MERFDAYAYMRSVRDDADLSSTQKHVALVLVTWASGVSGECHPSHGAVAEATGYNVQTVRRTLAALVKCGRLESTRTGKQAGGTLIYYTLRVHPTSTEDTSGEGGSSGGDDTNGSRKPTGAESTNGSEPTGTQGTSGGVGPIGIEGTRPLVPRASLLKGTTSGTTTRKHPLTTYAGGAETAEDGRRELDELDAEARKLDLDDRTGSPDARVLRAIDHLAGEQVRDRKGKGKRVTSPAGLRRTIRQDLLDEQYLGLLALARTGWSPRELAARAGNASYRPARPRSNGSAA